MFCKMSKTTQWSHHLSTDLLYLPAVVVSLAVVVVVVQLVQLVQLVLLALLVLHKKVLNEIL